MRIEQPTRAGIILGCVLAGLVSAPVPAQTTNDDVRCLMVSSGYARLAKDESSRRVSSMTGAFFLGQLSGRLSDGALVAAIRAQGTGLSGKEAEPVMRACAARAAVAEQKMSAAVRLAQRNR